MPDYMMLNFKCSGTIVERDVRDWRERRVGRGLKVKSMRCLDLRASHVTRWHLPGMTILPFSPVAPFPLVSRLTRHGRMAGRCGWILPASILRPLFQESGPMVLIYESDPLDNEDARGRFYHVCRGRIVRTEIQLPADAKVYECAVCGIDLEAERVSIADYGWEHGEKNGRRIAWADDAVRHLLRPGHG